MKSKSASRQMQRDKKQNPVLGKQSIPTPSARVAWVDQWRGSAVLMMIAYHFCYDLAYYRLVPWSTDQMLLTPGWIICRNCIVSLFLVLVGLSLSLRMRFKPAWSDFWKRWGQIAGAAVLVSIGSYGFAGDRWIYFGVLHFIAVATLLARSLYSKTTSAWFFLVCGMIALLIGVSFALSTFDAVPLNIIGLALHKPQTEDYVPLLPWLGVVLLGMALGSWVHQKKSPVKKSLTGDRSHPNWASQLLAFMGRHSLAIYLIHQPILMGGLMLLAT